MPASPYLGLPAEFISPHRTAQRLAELPTSLEREQFFERIPRHWQPLIAEFAILAIAHRIVEEPVKARRQDMLAATPEAWRADVKERVLNAWRARQLIAEADARAPKAA